MDRGWWGKDLLEDFALLADDIQLLGVGALEFLLQVNCCA